MRKNLFQDNKAEGNRGKHRYPTMTSVYTCVHLLIQTHTKIIRIRIHSDRIIGLFVSANGKVRVFYLDFMMIHICNKAFFSI